MNWFMVDFQSKDEQYKQYNGHIALTLGWSNNNDLPICERYVIIAPLKSKDYPTYINLTAFDCNGNNIIFDNPYGIGRSVIFETTDMIKFLEQKPIKPPITKWDKWGERKVYGWHWGKWIITGYEKKEEE